MKHLLLILTVCGFCAQSIGQTIIINSFRYSPPAPTYLLAEDFEGSGGGGTDDGYDGGTWFEANNPDEDYATAPAPLVPSQSIYFRDVTTGVRAFSPTFAGQDEAWLYFLYRPTTLGADTIALFRDGTGTLVQLDTDATGHLRVTDGVSAQSDYTTDAATTGTTWHVWLYYLRGTGADAQYSVGFSSDGVKPTSGNKFISVGGGASARAVDQIRLSSESGASAWIGDKVRVDDVVIGSNPP